MSVTQNLHLKLTAAEEISMTFLEWRLLMNGVDVDSNMELIDDAIGDLLDGVDGKADGIAFNNQTNTIYLTSNGSAIPGASASINLSNFYTKSEIDTMFSNIRGKLYINGSNRAVSTHTLSWVDNGTTHSYEVVTV